MGKTEYYCGYCGGDVIWSDENVQFEHSDDGERVDPPTPGDYVSAAHNRKGSRVNPVDVQRDDERDADEILTEPITDSAGYLSCGCHGSWSDHICKDRDASEYTPET